jgi:ketosteroid isomerase-like protein
MRRLFVGGVLLVGAVLAVLVVSLAAWGGSSSSSVSAEAVQQQADFWAIDEIEKNFHRATTKHDIELMMSLWAPNASFTVGPGQTLIGKKQIRDFWLTKSVAFEPDNHWLSDTAAYKVRITASGDRGTLYFECHYLDMETGKIEVITAADQEVARINGRWLITSMVGGSATLSP